MWQESGAGPNHGRATWRLYAERSSYKTRRLRGSWSRVAEPRGRFVLGHGGLAARECRELYDAINRRAHARCGGPGRVPRRRSTGRPAVERCSWQVSAGEDHVRITPLGTNGQEELAPLAARLSCRRCLIVFCGFFFGGSFGFSTPLGIIPSSEPVRYSGSNHTLRSPRARVIRAAADLGYPELPNTAERIRVCPDGGRRS